MVSFDKLEVEDLEGIEKSLEPCEGLEDIRQVISQGYSGSCLVLIRFKIEQSGKPVLWSNLLLGDLGLSGLERSLSHFSTTVYSPNIQS